jgi:hypothetical protein
MECRHLDGNRLNNHLSNLCWGTHQENIDDQIRHGTRSKVRAKGSLHGNAKLSEADIPVIRARLAAGETRRAIAKDFRVSSTTINFIAWGRTWTHVP